MVMPDETLKSTCMLNLNSSFPRHVHRNLLLYIDVTLQVAGLANELDAIDGNIHLI